MAATLPRPSRPSYGPPTTALPALPTSKTRKSTGGIPSPSDHKSELLNLPKSGLRTPSTSSIPTTPSPATALPKLRTTPGVNAAGKTIRKTISINAFPQPPRGGVRTTSLPPSPLSGSIANNAASRGESSDTSPLNSTAAKALRKRPKTASSPNSQTYNNSTPSLLNGSGDSRSISSGPGARGSDGLLSLPSPPQSRSSSAQESYSTSATTFDENGDMFRGRDSGDASDKRSSKPVEGKGNVIVSVRVRPDAGSNGESRKTDGEWMVDGRRALVAYKGREGGDYYYGT